MAPATPSRHPVRLVLLAAAALAGCVGDLQGNAVVSYHGDEAGSELDHFECLDRYEGGAVTMTVTYRGDVGKSFRATLKDPSGTEAFSQTFDLPGPEERTETFSVARATGEWSLVVERLDPFKGNIRVEAKCP